MKKNYVLFVDDEKRVLQSWKRIFIDEPYCMLFAEGGHEALQIIAEKKVAVVVSDYFMPHGNGIDFLKAIRTSHPQVCRILVSGQATLAVAREAINECAIDKLFQKPCNPIELGLAIRDGLNTFNRGESDTCSYKNNLYELERKHPGITKVRRNNQGVIEI